MNKIYKLTRWQIFMVLFFFGCEEGGEQFGGNNPKSGYVEIGTGNVVAINESSGTFRLPVNLNTSINPNGVNVSYTVEGINGNLPDGFADVTGGNVLITPGTDLNFIEFDIPDSNEEYSFRVTLVSTDDADFTVGLSDDSKVVSSELYVSLNNAIEVTIDENPDTGQVLVAAAANFPANTTFSLDSESVEGAFSIDQSTGEISVSDRFAFDFEVRTSLSATIGVSLGETVIEKTVTVNLNDVTIIWSGPDLTFTKPDNADWTLAENQDRITDDVWITRQNRFSIFNIAFGDITSSTPCNDEANNGGQPFLTRWAWGNTDDLSSLNFTTFLGGFACGPRNNLMIDADAVLQIYGEDIYIDIKWLSWSCCDLGGFSYVRSTPTP